MVTGCALTEEILSGATDEARPRVIVVTTFELDEYAFGALRAGASGFLLKRSRAEDIVSAVRGVADGESLPMPTMARRLISRYAERSAPRGSPTYRR